jgi:uncharacterized protein
MFENTRVADLALGRSTVRRRILALLMAEPGIRLHLREIQRRAGTSPGTASRELARLVGGGVIEREAEGNQVYFRASASPFATVLRSLLLSPPELGPDVAPPRTTSPAPALAPPLRIVEAPPAGGLPATPAPVAPETLPADAIIGPRLVRSELTKVPGHAPIAGIGPRSSGADRLGIEAGAAAAGRMRSLYGPRLRGVYLYGPRASEGAPPGSDVDLLVVLDRIVSYGEELELTSAICASLSLESRAVVSRIFVSEADWTGRSDGPLAQARAEAVAL